MKIIDRLFQYFEYKNIKPTAFEKAYGFSNGYFGKMKQRQADPGSDILLKIIDNCPDLNSDWLMKGNGAMIKKPPPPEGVIEDSPGKFSVQNGSLFKALDYLTDLNSRQSRDIERLEKEIERKEKEINRLTNEIERLTGHAGEQKRKTG